MKWKDLFDDDDFIRDLARSIEKVIRRNFPRVSADEKADISQEILKKIWKMIAGGKKIGDLRSYIWRVAYTTALDFVNEEGKYVNVDRDEELETGGSLGGAEDLSLESHLEHKHSKKVLLAAIEGLSPNRRVVLKLALTGMTVNEIAEFFGWSESKVNHLYYRGLEDLKKRMKEEKGIK
jgi:RNA polymerase sigma-70 factor (ECF subfamily)